MDTFPPREAPLQFRVSRQLVLAILAVVALFLIMAAIDFTTEWLWFDSLLFSSVFFTTVTARLVLFGLGVIAFLAIFALNVAIARRLAYAYRAPARRAGPATPWEDLLAQLSTQMGARGDYGTLINAGVVVAGVVLALLMGLMASGNWLAALQLIHMTPFGTVDPAFGADVAFYVFQVPILRAVQVWILTALVLVALSVLAVYALVLTYELAVNWAQMGTWLPRAMKAHLLAFAAVGFLLIASNHILDLFELVRSSRGAAYGASYTDLQAQRWAQLILAAAALGAGALCVINVATAGFRLTIIGAAVWGAALVVVGGIYPSIVQNIDVKPNELDRERPYIAYNIQYTRQAFGLDRIEEQDFPAEDAVAPSVLDTEQATIENVRLWDHRPLIQTLNQVQALRQYYHFFDVDLDRYIIDGKYRQVMIAPRELDPDRLPAATQTWVARQLQYTHGYGVAMSFVNVIAQEGLPQFTIRDVPPVGSLPVTQPEIYFGEHTSHYVVVRTATPEFDYPRGDEGVFTTYKPDAGIPVGSILNRVLFTLKFQDPNLILNTSIQSDSRLLYRRNIAERAREIAPFLRLDPDPYIAVVDGKLYWIHDTYTTTDRYPYSQPYRPPNQRRVFNYIRNSVKIVTNAYDGTMRFYVTEPSDPLIQTYQRIFPSLFVSQEEAPPALRAHFRYPEELFRIQADMYRLYHMTDPRVFYLREDMWAIPNELFFDQRQPVEPYYVIMKLPGEREPEFILMTPFVPATRDNMIGWLAARNDGPNYGRLLVYKYPKEKLIYGPLQLETRIDQDPTISAQFTLWGQAGSRIIRGNLLVIPMGRSNLYVEPIYLQATDTGLPELKRVIVATGNRIVMEPTLEEGLDKLFGRTGASPPPSAPPQPPAPPRPGVEPPAAPAQTVGQLAAEAQERFTRAQDALRAGEFARYGEELRALEEVLARLALVTP